MRKIIQSVRGMKDYLPNETFIWQCVEKIIKNTLTSYGYKEIRLPIIEYSNLFKRTIGDISDIIKKEMYNFIGKNGKELSLRPEGTASCVRSVIENGLLYKGNQRLWYIGPMFRYERPQKGRYRQFYQIGAEIFGQCNPIVDAEIIISTHRCWENLGISKHISLEINSIGSIKDRVSYCNALLIFLNKNKNSFDKEYYNDIYKNPIQLLDTKNPNVKVLLKDAPVITDYLNQDSISNFYKICKFLDSMGISYKINPRLVRGLDYYNNTVFEWVTSYLGSQGTICAGGRYDNLMKQLGNKKDVPAVGFAIGLDRLILLIKKVNKNLIIEKNNRNVYLAMSGKVFQSFILHTAEKLRDNVPYINLITDYRSGNLKKQLFRAYKSESRIAIILIENEMKTDKALLKDFFNDSQEIITNEQIINKIKLILD